MGKIYDMIIVGGGPGGYTAAMYAARAGMSVLVLEQFFAGGQMALTHQIDNYPGFENGIDGMTLAQNMQQQAERFGVETYNAQVRELDLKTMIKRVVANDESFYGKTVVLSTGANPRELGLKNEKELLGKGIHYCASCDGMFYKGKTVAIIGGGNTAVMDALLLSRVASKVYLLHRRDQLRATKLYHEQLTQIENVEICFNTVVEELKGEQHLTGVTIKNTKTSEISSLSCDGVFVSVGRVPATEILDGQVALDEAGYVMADESTETNLKGVYAVGDVRTKKLRQIVTAVADGANAVTYAEEYLASLEK